MLEDPLEYLSFLPNILDFSQRDMTQVRIQADAWEEIVEKHLSFVDDESILNSYKQGLYFYQLQEVWQAQGRTDFLETYKEHLRNAQTTQQNLA